MTTMRAHPKSHGSGLLALGVLAAWVVMMALAVGLSACAPAPSPGAGNRDVTGDRARSGSATTAGVTGVKKDGKTLQRAVFAGGCFWCMQPSFDKIPGVVSTRVGYTGGTVAHPSYGQVARKSTGHREAIEIWYRPDQVSYDRLLQVFWRSVDPTDAGGQFADRGSPYYPGIFYVNEKQRRAALASKAGLQSSSRFKKPIVVPILAAKPFYPAEKYHQKYYLKDPKRYEGYKWGSGRAGFLKRVWGKSSCR